ncbi:MAG TPA: hypothetical protein VG755_28895 [Nannocystaceae bacterium]|nr:hypothetical protein [Nannocystaceae bacterium]
MRGLMLGWVLAVGCVIEASECDELETKRSCERARAELGECAWLEVRAPVVEEDGTCRANPPSHGECVGFSRDTSQGCMGPTCEGNDAGGPTLFRVEGDRVETFVSPVCGGSLFTADEWQPCGGEDAPAECDCACAQ